MTGIIRRTGRTVPDARARPPDPGRLPCVAARHTQEAACGRVHTACARNAGAITTFAFASLPTQQNIQIRAPQLMSAEKPPTVQIGGDARQPESLA